MKEESPSGKAFHMPLFQRIFRMTLPYRGFFWIAVALTLLLAVVAPLRPILIQETVDNFILIPDKE